MTKMAKIDAPCITKMAEKPYPRTCINIPI